MAGNLVKKVMLKIVADDGDSEEKLDKISAKADELARKHPELTPKVNIAAASAKLAVLRRELKDTGRDADQEHHFSLSGIMPAIGEMSLFQKVMLATNVATTFAEPLLAGLVVTTMGLASGLTAAGAGLGAFGLLAKLNLSAASMAATAAQSAQTQYTSAVTAANAAYRKQMDAATTSTERQSAATARATAIQEAYRAKVQATTQAYAGLSPAQVSLSKSLGAIQSQWQKFTASFAGPTNTVVSQVRPLITDLLPDVRKLAMAGEAGISSMLSVIGAHGTGGLNRFVDMLAREAPQAVMKLGIAVAHVGSGIGGILRAFMPSGNGILTGLDKITAKFASWGQTLSSHSGFQSLMEMFRTETPLAVHDLGQLASIVKTVVADMTGLSGVGNSRALLELANPVLTLANALMRANPDLVRFALYLLAAGSAAGKLHSMFGKESGFASLISGVKGGVSALKNFRSGFTDSEKAASEATGAWGTFGGAVSKLKLSNLKAGFNDADAAASDATGVLGTLGGKLSTIGSSLASAASATGSFVATYAAKLGEAAVATGAWIAEHAVATASFIAENVAMAASATVAFVAENAATLGLVAGIGAVVAGIVFLAMHWRTVWHDITAVVDTAVHWIESHWKLLPAIFLGPVGLVATIVLTHLHDIEHFFEDAWHEIEHLTDDLVSFVESHWQLLATILATVLTGPIGGLVVFIATHWDEIRSETGRLVDDVVSFFEQLPGRIMRAIGDLGSLLYRAGANAIEGLIHGIGSMVGSAIHTVEGWGHDIVSALGSPFGIHFSEPSEATTVIAAGRRIPQALAAGMDSGRGLAAAAAARLSRAVAIPSAAAGSYSGALGAAAAGGGWLEARLVTETSDPLMKAFAQQLKLYIRVKGGGGPNSVQKALGQGT
jgi:hypothetical protein